jgi:hypothetical protein
MCIRSVPTRPAVTAILTRQCSYSVEGCTQISVFSSLVSVTFIIYFTHNISSQNVYSSVLSLSNSNVSLYLYHFHGCASDWCLQRETATLTETSTATVVTQTAPRSSSQNLCKQSHGVKNITAALWMKPGSFTQVHSVVPRVVTCTTTRNFKMNFQPKFLSALI